MIISLCILVYRMDGSLSETLADIVLPEADGREIQLRSLWERGPAVLVFLRHYG